MSWGETRGGGGALPKAFKMVVHGYYVLAPPILWSSVNGWPSPSNGQLNTYKNTKKELRNSANFKTKSKWREERKGKEGRRKEIRKEEENRDEVD